MLIINLRIGFCPVNPAICTSTVRSGGRWSFIMCIKCSCSKTVPHVSVVLVKHTGFSIKNSGLNTFISIAHLLFSHLAYAFIQSDLQIRKSN